MPASPGSSSFFNLIVDHGGIQGLTDDDHTQYPFFSTGTGTPVGAVTPQRVGHIYVATDLENAWIATNTTNADWEQLDAAGGGGGPSVSTGAGAPVSTPSAEGDIYIDTTNDQSYMAVGTASSSDWKQTSNLPQGITSVSDDTSPTLGGDLDGGGFAITNIGDVDGVDISALVSLTIANLRSVIGGLTDTQGATADRFVYWDADGTLQQCSHEDIVTQAHSDMGIVPQKRISTTVDPTVNDDSASGYAVNDLWTNTTTDNSWICQDITTGAAVWTQIDGGGGGVSDHGALTGLADDDHTQYFRHDGTRLMTAALNMGGFDITNVGDVDGVDVSALVSLTIANLRSLIGGLTDAQGATADRFLYWDSDGTLQQCSHEDIVTQGFSDLGIVPQKRIATTVDPTVNDDSASGYAVNDLWTNTTDDTSWICVDATATAAVWKPIALTKTGTAAPAVAPDFVGQLFLDTTNENIYIGIDTVNAADFLQVNGGGGDLWSDVVDADIVPDADGTRDLGADATRFAQAYIDELHSTGGLLVTESADHTNTPAAGKGEYWVRNDTPCVPVFTDDAGTDHVLNAAGGGTDVSVLSVEKNTAGTINKGQVVYVAGYDTDKPTVELADADASAALPPIGVANASITDSTAGDVVMSGIVDGMDTSAFTAGDNVYLDTTAGALVATRPDEEFVYRIGQVIYSHASNGVLRVNIERVQGRYWIYGVVWGLSNSQRLDNWFVGQATGTVESVEFSAAKYLSGSDASNYWTFDIQNASESDRSILAAPYDMTTDPTWKTWVDLGAVNGTAANLEVTRGDLINLEVRETGNPPSLGTHSISIRIKVKPAN